MSYERWVIVVMDRERTDWQARFLAELAEHGVTLEGDELKLRGELVGSARFEPLTAASSELTAWIGAGSRPYLGAPVALLMWRHYVANESEIRDLVPAIARAARGAVERLDDHEVREVVVHRRFPLSHLLSEYGLDEGQALLERVPGPYTLAVALEVRRIVDEHKLDVWGSFDAESRPNPLRVLYQGTPIASMRRALDDAAIELWAFAPFVYESDPFWNDAGY